MKVDTDLAETSGTSPPKANSGRYSPLVIAAPVPFSGVFAGVLQLLARDIPDSAVHDDGLARSLNTMPALSNHLVVDGDRAIAVHPKKQIDIISATVMVIGDKLSQLVAGVRELRDEVVKKRSAEAAKVANRADRSTPPASTRREGRAESASPWLNYEEAADRIGCSVGRLRNMVSAGEIPVYGKKHRRRFKRDMIDLFVSDPDVAMRKFRLERNSHGDQ